MTRHRPDISRKFVAYDGTIYQPERERRWLPYVLLPFLIVGFVALLPVLILLAYESAKWEKLKGC